MGIAGPFAVLGRTFVVESSDADFLGSIADAYADLRLDAPPTDATIYRVERIGPTWHPFAWGIWRDGDQVNDEAQRAFLLPFIASDFARRTTADTPTAIALNGVALARRPRAVVVTADVMAPGEQADEEPVDLTALAARLMHAGWALVALDVLPVETGVPRACVLPFHRPLSVDPRTRLAEMLGTGDHEPLVVPSRIGQLAEATELGAFVAVRPGANGSSIEPASPAAVLRALAAQLGGGADVRRASFRRLASLVEHVPGMTLEIGKDLDAAAVAMEALG